ncbi:hypothetical protein L9F63_006134 [Diploptera punctata]|uniref:Ionotropic glutamate receptor C-terminal domain-containing protein n=1 Tax=Diploptera punctata TaxID=6984 RepID=A0AAD7ZAU8_DIPPU|nr:hypothetical protein L9F63_006134 [Diploptera punctata]
MKEMTKIFSTKYIQVATHTFNNLIQLRQSECQGSNPLNVVIASDRLIKLPLTKAEGLWLVFLEAGQETNEFLQDVYIPINCEFIVGRITGPDSIKLNEVYRMAPGHILQRTTYGTWLSQQGFQTPILPLVKRRSNFHGHTITATAMNYPPLMKMDKNNRMTGGLFGMVWMILEKRLNFQTVYVEPEQKTWGAVLPNNTSTGIVGMLHSGKAEVAVFNMLMTTRRMEVMDFTIPLLNPTYHIFIRKPEQITLEWDMYLAPFTRRLWCALVVLILIISSILPFIYCVGHYHGLDRNSVNNFRIRDSLFIILAAFCQQGVEKDTPQFSSCRVLYVTTYFTAVIILASYSATLVSFLTVGKIILPFTDLEDVLRAGTHKLGAVKTSTVLYHFRSAQTGLYQRVQTHLLHEKHNSLVTDIQSGLLRVCQEPYLFMAMNTEVLPYLSQMHCDITSLPVTYFRVSLSMGLRLYSPYKPFINYELQCLYDQGLLQSYGKVCLLLFSSNKLMTETGSVLAWNICCPYSSF